MKKTILITLLFIVVAGVIVYFVIVNKQNIYQNTKYNYSFSYPANFTLSEHSKADSQDASIISKDEPLTIINIHASNTSVGDNTGKCPQDKKVTSLIVDGQNVEICQGYDERFDFYTFIPRDPQNTNDDIYVDIQGDTDKKKQIQKVFESFMSTFKFTE